MVSALEFEAVSKAYGEHEVLRDVTLRVAPGEAVGLVGINGAGKTTLIRGLLDLNRIDTGRIKVFGAGHTDTHARRELCYLAERFAPPAFASGHELLAYLLRLHDVDYVRAQAETEARALDLDVAALERSAREYSKGMAQKLGLIACILPQRRLLILDEPMSGLDPRARASFKRRLAELKRAGTTLFFSTHLLVDVESLCDRIVILHGGRIAYDGSPAALMTSTASDSLEDAFLRCVEVPGG